MKNTIALLLLLFSTTTFSQSAAKQEDTNIYALKGLEVQPEFPGGVDKLKAMVNESYLKAGHEYELKGKVYFLFVIEKDGSLSGIKMLKGIDTAKAATLIKILQSMPKWQPGKQNGTIVRVHYVLEMEIGT